ncbi:MAG TPA: hypothetical protein VHE37_04295, partial [Nevskiaceae bacterium]|nr:hypothetical protein [Nevskiaceae bacterium]
MQIHINKWLAACCAALLVASCGHNSIPGSIDNGGNNGGGALSGNLGPGDGDSIYLNVLPPGANGNSSGGIGVPVGGT